jgi:hypothetical protein
MYNEILDALLVKSVDDFDKAFIQIVGNLGDCRESVFCAQTGYGVDQVFSLHSCHQSSFLCSLKDALKLKLKSFIYLLGLVVF